MRARVQYYTYSYPQERQTQKLTHNSATPAKTITAMPAMPPTDDSPPPRSKTDEAPELLVLELPGRGGIRPASSESFV